MTTPKDRSDRSIRRLRFLLPGESAVAFIGISLAAILLATTLGSAWWTMHTQRAALENARIEQVKAVGELLAGSAESMLAADALSAVRRMVVETAIRHDLTICRITKSDNEIVADADARQINVTTLASTWPEPPPEAATETLTAGTLTISYPLAVRGRQVARLTLGAATRSPMWLSFEAQVGAGGIGVLSLLALLFVYRHTRARLRAASAIREALLSIHLDQATEQTALLSEDLGAEASTWNELLAEKGRLHEQVVTQRAAKSLHNPNQAPTDLGAACDAMSQGLILLDGDLAVRYANGAAAVFLEFKREHALGKKIAELVTDEQVIGSIRRIQGESSRRRGIVEVDRRGEGAGGVLRFITRPVRRGDSGVAMLIIEDITQQRVAEEARHSFVAQAAHELRTPLTNIRLHVETAIEDGDDQPQLMAQSLNVISQESRRLERIVTEMLSVAEIDAGTFSLRKDDVSLSAMFAQLEEDYLPQAREKEIELTFDVTPKLPLLQGDRDKIMLALHNLVGNAIKYTPAGGKVTIRVDVEADQLTVQVVDDGIGINDDDAIRIFEKFYRAKDKRVSQITGSGLGLALARQVIQLHGGDITVESHIDKGSTFTLALPVEPQAA